MSEIIKSIILGIVQGLTEFLPVSSSGHLVLFEEMLDFKEGGLTMEIFVHFGTLLAVMVVFRKDLWRMLVALPSLPGFVINGLKIDKKEDEYKAMTFFIFVGSLPAAFLGLMFKDHIEMLFDNPVPVLFTLLLTAIILWSSRYTEEDRPFLNGFEAFVIGFAQAFAIIPGVSRSGATIIMALWLGINRQIAAKFSFLLSVPVILGATLLQLKEIIAVPLPRDELIHLIVATITAAISGYFAIIWLLGVIRKNKLEWFGLYCACVSIIGFVFVFFFQK